MFQQYKIKLGTIRHICTCRVANQATYQKCPHLIWLFWWVNIWWIKAASDKTHLIIVLQLKIHYLPEHFVQTVTVIKCHCPFIKCCSLHVNNICKQHHVLYFFFARMHVLPSSGRSLDVHYARFRHKASKLPHILHINIAHLGLNGLFQC